MKPCLLAPLHFFHFPTLHLLLCYYYTSAPFTFTCPPFSRLLHFHATSPTHLFPATTPCRPFALLTVVPITLPTIPPHYTSGLTGCTFVLPITFLSSTITVFCPHYTPVHSCYTFSTLYTHHDSIPLLHFWPFQPSLTLHLCPANSPCHPPVGNAANISRY